MYLLRRLRHGDWNVKRGIRVAPSRRDWSVDVSVLRRLYVLLAYARRLIDLTVLVVVIPIEDWTYELFRVFPRASLFRFLLSAVQRFSYLSFKVFQNGWGFTDLATKPAPFWLSRYVTNTVPNHIHRMNKKFAVYDFQSICNLNHIVHTYLIY